MKPLCDRAPTLLATALLFSSLGLGLLYGLDRSLDLGLTQVSGGVAALLVGALLAGLDARLPPRLFRLGLAALFCLAFFDTLVTLAHTLLFFAILAAGFASVVFGNPVGLYLLGRRAGRRKV